MRWLAHSRPPRHGESAPRAPASEGDAGINLDIEAMARQVGKSIDPAASLFSFKIGHGAGVMRR